MYLGSFFATKKEKEIDYCLIDSYTKTELVDYIKNMRIKSFEFCKNMFDSLELKSNEIHSNLIEIVQKLPVLFPPSDNKNKKLRKRSKMFFAKYDLVKDYEETTIENKTEFITNFVETPTHKFNTDLIDLDEYINSFGDDKFKKDMMGISKKLLQVLPKYYVNKMLTFYNKNISEGANPKYSFGRTIFAHKKGDKNDLSNYRKITTIPNFINHFHRIISFRIKKYLEKNNYFDKTIQKAGLSGNNYGIFEQVFKVRSVIKDANQNKKPVAVLFLDLSSAFDTIDRNRVYEVMEEYNIDPNVIRYIRQYYENFEYVVAAGRKSSELRKWNAGLIQGCSLSPLLFTLCMNYVLSHINRTSLNHDGYKFTNTDCKALFFAFMDDICITTKNLESMNDIYEELLENFEMLGLKINKKKSALMVINEDSEVPELLKDIPVVQQQTYLGNVITSNGEYKTNYDEVLKNIYSY